MLTEVLSWELQPSFITDDSGYSGVKNLKAIKNNGLGFMFTLKSNRRISVIRNEYLLIKDLDIPEEGLEAWLREFEQVKVFRTMLKDE